MTLLKCPWDGTPIGKIEGKFEGYCPRKGCGRLVTLDTLSTVGVSLRS